jgi:hypothetical protein
VSKDKHTPDKSLTMTKAADQYLNNEQAYVSKKKKSKRTKNENSKEELKSKQY